MVVITRQNQSLFDIAAQEAGTIEAVFELAVQNNMAITDGFAPGITLNADNLPTDTTVLAYMKKHEIAPATVDDSKMWQGIGYWIIETDFII